MISKEFTITEPKSNWRDACDKIKSILNEFMLSVLEPNQVCINHQEISEDNKAITYKLYNSSRKLVGELRFRVELV